MRQSGRRDRDRQPPSRERNADTKCPDILNTVNGKGRVKQDSFSFSVTDQMSCGVGSGVEPRRRASSNFFEIESSRSRQTSHSLRASINNLNGNEYLEFQDETAIDLAFEQLVLKFGFQRGSVENQKEHVLLLLANYKLRQQHKSVSGGVGSSGAHGGTNNPSTMEVHVTALHDKLFGNYKEWCGFLHTQPHFYPNSPYMDMSLYFLIWGESANLRHMPECICFLYHKMMEVVLREMDEGAKISSAEYGDFLKLTVRPIWKRLQKMQQKTDIGRHIEHTKVRNYDDLNEFFWDKDCLTCNLGNVANVIDRRARKTFMEKRSIFTLILNYYRIFHFNLMFFLLLTVLAFVATVSPSSVKGRLHAIQQLGTPVAPFEKQDLQLAGVAIPLVHAILCTIKCFLEFWTSWRLFFTNCTYLIALIARLVWNGTFVTIFSLIVSYPDQQSGSHTFLDLFTAAFIIYIAPAACILVLQVVSPTTLAASWAIKYIRGGKNSYIGNNMSPHSRYVFQYIGFWIVLWTIKAIVSYSLLIQPLMLPSIGIYSMKLNYSSVALGDHNMGIILALWLPVFFVFVYDTQIYFTVLQAIVGAIKGLLIHSGEVHGFTQLTKSFRVAPQLFDQKVVTRLARSYDGDQESPFHSQMMLRFVVVWNEIVNSFRQGDLVDDKEAAILQYDIQDTGEVFEPVFLSAGKLGDAFQTLTKAHKQGKSDSALRIRLVEDDCIPALKSFYSAALNVLTCLFGGSDNDIIDVIQDVHRAASQGKFMSNFQIQYIVQLKTTIGELLEAVLDLPDPTFYSNSLQSKVHAPHIVRHFVSKVEGLLNCLQVFTKHPVLVAKLAESNFTKADNDYSNAASALLNLFSNEIAMGAATRAYLLLSLERQDAIPQCREARRRLGFFMKSLLMDIPQLKSIREMHSFSVVTPYYCETVLFSIEELNNPLENHPIFKKVEEGGKNITILKYLTTCHPNEWENFLERMDVATAEEALISCPQAIRLWASNRGQTLARTVQGMMLYEDAIKILHWLEIGSNSSKGADEKQKQLQDIVRLKFSYICGCQVYGEQRAEERQQADDIDFLLHTYPNFRVAFVDTKVLGPRDTAYDSVLIKSEGGEIVEVYRYELPGDPIVGEGKPENQNNAIAFTRGEFLQTIDMNQEHYFEEALKMPQLLETADLHPSGKPVSIIGMREHIFTGNASSLAKFKTWQELVFVTLSQRVLADPLYCRMHYGHPDVFDKVLAITRGGVSKASKGINLSEDVFAGFNTVLRGGVVTHVEFMQCGKGRDVALSQISMFEAKLANGSGETSLSRDVGRMGQFMDFFRLNSTFYAHTGFYFATWLTVVTAFVYMYSKLFITLSGVERQIIGQMNSTEIVTSNPGFDELAYDDLTSVINTQYLIQAGLFLTLPLIAVYFTEMGPIRGMLHFMEMIATLGPAFFVFQVGTTSHYFDNNLLHGGAKYQATGRGFKITRESFVLLYKAYANSHYKKAFELIGLCFIFVTFGDFNICYKETEDLFGNRFCSSFQGYGAQTFAIWFIAVVWLLSPYFFNTDGLDWEKTKIDIVSWMHWMFMDKDEEDEDPTNVGGWISWWTSEMEVIQGSSVVARLTVLLRESRHFFLVWYVVSIRFKSSFAVISTFAAVGVTLVFFWLMGYVGLTMKGISPKVRACIYVLCLFSFIATYMLVGVVVYGFNQDSCMSLFFGYFGALYGVCEILRIFNWPSFQITSSIAYQQLAFFFDFSFGLALQVPLFIMSGIPFMNVIQTRMMYNEGFSKVMSASNQYAFSLCAFTGILGGMSCGWILYLLNSLKVSADFSNYTETLKLNFDKTSDLASYLVPVGSALGAFLSGLIGHFIGRRWPIVLGGITSLIALSVLSAAETSPENQRENVLFYGFGLLSAAVGMVMSSIVVYNYEISTKEFRGKSVLLLGVGVSIGGCLGSYLAARGSCSWLWQIFWATLIIGFVTPVINAFPESPIWILGKYGTSGCEMSLTILRRKQAIGDELAELKSEYFSGSSCSSVTIFKLFVVFALQIVYAFSTLSIFSYHLSLFYNPSGSSTISSSVIMVQIVGSLMAFFFIDRFSRKTIIAISLIPIAICIGLYTCNDILTIWRQSDSDYNTIVALALGVFVGLGLVSSVWIAAVELFNARLRSLFVGLTMSFYFVTPAFNAYVDPLVFLFTFIGFAVASSFIVFSFFSTNRHGAICTPAESKLDVLDEVPETPGSTRTNRVFSRSRSKSSAAFSNYSMFESPGGPMSLRN